METALIWHRPGNLGSRCVHRHTLKEHWIGSSAAHGLPSGPRQHQPAPKPLPSEVKPVPYYCVSGRQWARANLPPKEGLVEKSSGIFWKAHKRKKTRRNSRPEWTNYSTSFPISFLGSSTEICLSLSCFFLIILKGLWTPGLLTEKICIFHSIWPYYQSSSSPPHQDFISCEVKTKKKKDSLENKKLLWKAGENDGLLGWFVGKSSN